MTISLIENEGELLPQFFTFFLKNCKYSFESTRPTVVRLLPVARNVRGMYTRFVRCMYADSISQQIVTTAIALEN